MKRRYRKRILLWCMALIAMMLTVCLAANWTAVRRALIAADALYFDEILWNLTHPARPPKLDDLPPPVARDWVGHTPIAIAHALAPQAGVPMNSLTALADTQALGFTVLEVDLALTSDGDVLCFHEDDSDRREPPLLSTRQIQALVGDSASCTLQNLVHYARTHPRVRFIIDLKSRFLPTYRRIRDIIADPKLAKQFIPQLYDFADLGAFRRDRFFAEPIFTGYRSPLSNREIIEAARRFQVDIVVLHESRIARLTTLPSDIKLLAHPVDDRETALRLLCEKGVDGLYTIDLPPSKFPELYDPKKRVCDHR